MSASLDKLGRKILALLVEDSRLSSREIARRVGAAPATVSARIKQLEHARIIRGYTTLVDHERIGYDLTVLTEITVLKGKLLEMEREIAKHPAVCAVYDITGLTDAAVIAKFRTRHELSQFTKHLLSLPFIERTNTHVILTTVKEDFRIAP